MSYASNEPRETVNREQVVTLLIEDSPTQAALIIATLEADTFYDYKIATVPSLAKAKLAIDETSFDLILLDLILENGAGVQVIQEIRKVAPNTPLVVITNLSGKQIEVESIMAMADAFATKHELCPEHLQSIVLQVMVRARRVAPDIAPTVALTNDAAAMAQRCEASKDAPPWQESEKRQPVHQ